MELKKMSSKIMALDDARLGQFYIFYVFTE